MNVLKLADECVVTVTTGYLFRIERGGEREREDREGGRQRERGGIGIERGEREREREREREIKDVVLFHQFRYNHDHCQQYLVDEDNLIDLNPHLVLASNCISSWKDTSYRVQ